MSLPWSGAQLEWLREIGFEVMARRTPQAHVATPPADARAMVTAEAGRASALQARSSGSGLPLALQRAARGIDLATLLADGPPRDPAARRALWRALRPLRKAARAR